jgi:hypothetical protein
MEEQFDDQQLREAVRSLRSRGLTTNAIARELGVARGRIAPLVRELARERTQRTLTPELLGCWVSAGWSVGLAVPEERRWPDRAEHGHEGSGLVAVLVAREHLGAGGEVSVCGYLVDTYCLGVKDALGPRVTSRRGLARFASRYYEPFDGGRIEAPVELARHLVWGAAAYAGELGFDPHPDFWPAAGHLETLDGPCDIGFGLNGKPSYVSGPFDDVGRILSTLEGSVGLDNAHFTVAAPLELA